MNVKQRFAQNLIEQRKANGAALGDLARRASVPLPHLEAIERAEEEPEMETVIKLAGSLGVPIESLVAGMTWDPVDGLRVSESS